MPTISTLYLNWHMCYVVMQYWHAHVHRELIRRSLYLQFSSQELSHQVTRSKCAPFWWHSIIHLIKRIYSSAYTRAWPIINLHLDDLGMWLTFPQQQTLGGHRGPDHKTVGLVKRVCQTLQLLRSIYPRPQGHRLLGQRHFGSVGNVSGSVRNCCCSDKYMLLGIIKL